MITPTQARKAAKLGIELQEVGGGMVNAVHANTNTKILCSSPADAFKQVPALVMLKQSYGDGIEITQTLISIARSDGRVLKGGPLKPAAALNLVQDEANWETPGEPSGADSAPASAETPEQSTETPVTEPDPDDASGSPDHPERDAALRNEAGVSLDGAVAYAEGTPAGDNPYMAEGVEETDETHANAEAWDAAWDAAADAAEAAKPVKGGSVVHDRYRVRYAEAGHPTHCGDWLAETLNNLVLNKAGTNLELFEAICNANGVDLSAYRREGKGWEGRFRMTGRNLMAKKVYLAGGVLNLPDGTALKAPKDWMETQRFKMPKADQAKPIPTAE